MSEIKKYTFKGEEVKVKPERMTVSINVQGLDKLYHVGMKKEALDLGIIFPRFMEFMWEVYQEHKLCPKEVSRDG